MLNWEVAPCTCFYLLLNPHRGIKTKDTSAVGLLGCSLQCRCQPWKIVPKIEIEKNLVPAERSIQCQTVRQNHLKEEKNHLAAIFHLILNLNIRQTTIKTRHCFSFSRLYYVLPNNSNLQDPYVLRLYFSYGNHFSYSRYYSKMR